MSLFMELVESGFIIRPYGADDHNNIGIPNSSATALMSLAIRAILPATPPSFINLNILWEIKLDYSL